MSTTPDADSLVVPTTLVEPFDTREVRRKGRRGGRPTRARRLLPGLRASTPRSISPLRTCSGPTEPGADALRAHSAALRGPRCDHQTPGLSAARTPARSRCPPRHTMTSFQSLGDITVGRREERAARSSMLGRWAWESRRVGPRVAALRVVRLRVPRLERPCQVRAHREQLGAHFPPDVLDGAVDPLVARVARLARALVELERRRPNSTARRQSWVFATWTGGTPKRENRGDAARRLALVSIRRARHTPRRCASPSTRGC